MGAARSSLALAFLGVLLLANGAYVYPDSVSYEQEYRAVAEPIDEEAWPTGQFDVTTIHECAGGIDSEDCAQTRYLARVGQIRVEEPGDVYGPVLNESEQLPEFFYVDERYYQRTAHLQNGSLVLAMEPVDRRQVLSTTARNVSEVREVYRHAVDNGSVTTTEELHRNEFIVQDGDRFHRVWSKGPIRGEATGWGWKEPGQDVIQMLRLFGWIGGIALLWYAGYRFADRS